MTPELNRLRPTVLLTDRVRVNVSVERRWRGQRQRGWTGGAEERNSVCSLREEGGLFKYDFRSLCKHRFICLFSLIIFFSQEDSQQEKRRISGQILIRNQPHETKLCVTGRIQSPKKNKNYQMAPHNKTNQQKNPLILFLTLKTLALVAIITSKFQHFYLHRIPTKAAAIHLTRSISKRLYGEIEKENRTPYSNEFTSTPLLPPFSKTFKCTGHESIIHDRLWYVEIKLPLSQLTEVTQAVNRNKACLRWLLARSH